MNNEKAIRLIQKYKQGELTPDQEYRLNEWYLLTVAESKDELTTKEIEQTVERLRSKLPLEEPVKKIKLWPRIAVAAAAVFIVAGVFFFRSSLQSKLPATQYDVAAGKIGATLTLANGKVIRLTDVKNGEIAKEAGIRVTKTADGQLIYDASNLSGTTADENLNPSFNTLSTNKGETYMLILPDKSRVWMNAASTLTYSTTLKDHGKRRVKLEGEAYFEIAKLYSSSVGDGTANSSLQGETGSSLRGGTSSSLVGGTNSSLVGSTNSSLRGGTPKQTQRIPFIVETKGQEIEVLGTHFNVNAYSDEPVKTTTLLEGAIKITSNQNELILKPGEQASNDGKMIRLAKIKAEDAIDWKRGEFNLDHLNFKIAMRKIARWYDVDVIYNASVPDDMEIGGWVSRAEKLSSVLKSIESAGLVHFKIEGRKIYVTK